MIELNLPELLSPAGSTESLYAAVANGCDAVYLGGRLFSARRSAANFTLQELEDACRFCHLRGVKVYVTVNTVYKDKELPALYTFVEQLYHMGVDALIIQDMGVADFIHANFPDFPLHASTQMTANNVSDVLFMQEHGFSKVVLSRELSLDEIKEITAKVEVEIETFVHGALCVSYSGQCIMSSMLGGRSGNRGGCAQTCRLPYSLYQERDKIIEGHLLSPKDIQTITILPELIAAGISSLKIEGRMKNAEYVAGVTQIYRKYLDQYAASPETYSVDKEDMKQLTQLFNRGGFSEGYYETYAGNSMMCIERPKTWGLKTGFVDSYDAKSKRVTIRTREPLIPGDGIEIWTQKEPHVGSNISRKSKAGEVISFIIDGDISKNDVVYKTHDKLLSDAMKKTWEKDTRKKMIQGSFKAKLGEPMVFQAWDERGASAFATGNVVEQAQKQPLSPETLERQLKKTGATPFCFESLTIDADEGIYIGISDINELRREVLQKLEAAIHTIYERPKKELPKLQEYHGPIQKGKRLNVLVSNQEQFEVVCNHGKAHILYYELCGDFQKNIEKCIEKCHNNGMKLFAALPRIDRKTETRWYDDFIEELKQSDIDGFLIRSYGQFREVSDCGKPIIVDYNMNVFHRQDVLFWKNQGATSICISPELNLQEINTMADVDCEMLVYGFLPLMTTQQCPVGNYDGGKEAGVYCSKKGNNDLYFLKDRKGMKFPLMTNCEQCVCTVLNGQPLFTLKFYDEILESTTGSVRLLFTKEGPRRTERILNAYWEMTQDCKRISPETNVLLGEMSERGSTKGHFFRGVE